MEMEKAIFAGGCFWCTTKKFHELPGILELVSGYIGGHVDNPTYEQVKTGETGHYEATQITYDPALFSYEELLDFYWQIIDPTDASGQFQDRGASYRTAIFYGSTPQQSAALKSRDALAASGRFQKPIVTEILPATIFYPAEEYHQMFHLKDAARMVEEEVLRDAFIKENWA